jgi:hypothetical protein
MKTTEERVAELERRMDRLEELLAGAFAPLPFSLEEQHRLKLAARAKAKED